MNALKTISKATALVCFVLFFASALFSTPGSKVVPKPGEYFGFKPGTDRMLVNYEELVAYLQKVEEASGRVKLVDIGKTPLGRTMYVVFVSSEENIRNLDVLKQINKKLALDANIPNSERQSLIENGRVFCFATLSMHSEEVGPSQALPLIVYDLATTEDPGIKGYLQNVVYMATVCHNPDGMAMVVDYYKKMKGTKYEGESLPGVYHKYVGHDNNRDFLSLTQSDTRAVAAVYNKEWFPQVMVEKHQMGSSGPRYFVPPPHDPIAEVVDEGLWNWIGLFGANMVKDMNHVGLYGLTQEYLFDEYWLGSTETSIWKNIIGFLTEAASARVATPLFVEDNELRAGGKGLAEYKKSIKMTRPWPGGWWGIKDLIDLEYYSTISMIKTCSIYKDEILQFRNDICRKEVELGKTRAPFYFILPQAQHDRSELVNLVNLLMEHGVFVYRTTAPTTIDGLRIEEGDIVVPLAQPYRAFLIEAMEKQKYPVRRFTPGGEVMRPYDVASWSLPLHMGVKSNPLNTKSPDLESLLDKIKGTFALKKDSAESFKYALFSVNDNESFKAAFLASQIGLKVERTLGAASIDGNEYPKGSFIVHCSDAERAKGKRLLAEIKVAPAFLNEKLSVDSQPLIVPRIALVESYFHDMDAGWTRYLFDYYYIPYTVVRPGDFEKTDFVKNFDLVIFPDQEKSVLMDGKYKSYWDSRIRLSEYPPEYSQGIGKKGMDRLMTFLDQGGMIVSWGNSTALFMDNLEIPLTGDKKEEFKLPIDDISEKLTKKGFSCPGSLVEVLLAENHPLTLGMCGKTGVFFNGNPVFSTSIPGLDTDRRVIGKFPEDDILMSGYCENENELSQKSAMVWLKKGRGQLVLFAFAPQFRASTQATYKLLFNSLLMPKIK